MSAITFRRMSANDIALFLEWVKKEHMKQTWPFHEYGYDPREYILKKVEGNGYDYPFVILIDTRPVGYIQYCDLFAYRTLCPNPKGVFTKEPEGTFGIDIFIGEEDYINKGYGTRILQEFCNQLFSKPTVKRLVIDPRAENHRAISCYDKVGFKQIREAFDGVAKVLIMENVR